MAQRGETNAVLENFVKNYLPDNRYYRHSDIDLFLNITITNLLNYDYLLTDDDREFINQTFHHNTKYIDDINKEKREAFLQLIKNDTKGASTTSNANNNKKHKQTVYNLNTNKQNRGDPDERTKSILTYNFPKFELYFVGKLFVNGIPIEPEYTTKLLFSNQMEQKISMRYKYKDLTPDSYITLSIYSMQLPQGRELLGSTTIRLFDRNFNVTQGRHVYKIQKKIQVNVDNESILSSDKEHQMFDKELDNLICTFYKTNKKASDKHLYTNIPSYDDMLNMHEEELINTFYYDKKKDAIVMKDDYLLNFESKLNLLLTQTKDSYIEVDFPAFDLPIIFDENKTKPYAKTPKSFSFKEKSSQFFSNSSTWICDPLIQSGIYISKENTLSKSTPINEKIEKLALNEVSCDKDRKPSQYISEVMNEALIQPDFIENSHAGYFWMFRYYLLNQNKKSALTKICNAVVWENQNVQDDFIHNILKHWKDVEICDILYLLSRAFSLNPAYSKKSELTNKKEQRKENEQIEREGFRKLRSYAVQQLRSISDENLNFILLQLVQALRYEDKNKSELKEFLIEKCSQSSLLGTSFYWFIQVEASKPSTVSQSQNQSSLDESITEYYRNIRDKFLQEVEKYPEVNELIHSQIKLKKTLFEISSTMSQVPKKTEARKAKFKELVDPSNEKGKEIYTESSLPLDHNIKVNGIKRENCTVFRSALFPVKYAFTVTEETQQYNTKEDKDTFEVMFKYGDDLRQDQLILQIINYMDSILQKVHLDYEFTTYKVLATSKEDGFVEFVPNSKTIYDISKEYSKNIIKYLEENIKDDKEGKKKEKKLDSFLNSVAGYCVVTYLLGIGDRHLENILVNKNGKLFHIDFGYILGKDPKPYPPPMKISSEMVDCIGDKWEDFKTKCVNAFWVLRDNARLIVNLFYLMIDAGIPELNDVEVLKKLNEKFVQHQTRQQASITLLSTIESCRHFRYAALDFAHDIATKFH